MTERRTVVKGLGAAAAVAGLGLLSFRGEDGGELRLTPAEAYARSVRLTALTPAEANTLGALGEALVPGARAEGVAQFVDAHLAADPAKSLLMIRYLDVPPPYLPFYRAGLAALDGLAQARHQQAYAALTPALQSALIPAFAAARPAEWRGPPSPLFYFVTRADAIDVVYGTEQGFERLGVPYLAHIAPETRW